MRMCQLFAESVAVLCPYCGEPQPNTNGSEMWIAEDFKDNKLNKCVSCDKAIQIPALNKVRFEVSQ